MNTAVAGQVQHDVQRYSETLDAITRADEEEAERVARRDWLHLLLWRSDELLDRAELLNRDDRPKIGGRLHRDIRKLELEALGEMTPAVVEPQQAVDCLFSLQSVLLDWLEPGYDHEHRREGNDG